MVWFTRPPLAVVSMNFACPPGVGGVGWGSVLHCNCVLLAGAEGAWRV